MKHFNKILFSVLFLVCFSAANAQSDLLASKNEFAPPSIVALYNMDEKISISEFTPYETYGNSRIDIKCAFPLNVLVKFFKLDGNIAKQETHALDKGMNELSMDMNDLDAGIYMVQFYSKEGSAVRRFVKENKSTYTSFNSQN